MPEIVYLVGFMGAGKTCVGRLLADMLQYGFVDLDARIEKRAGESIRVIFAHRGEPFFRTLETQELASVSLLKRQVVALGGGAFCLDDNRRIVQGSGTSVWLDAPLSTLYTRCAREGSRPLFSTRDEMEALLGSRRSFYEKADLRVDVDERTPDEIAAQIAGLVRG